MEGGLELNQPSIPECRWRGCQNPNGKWQCSSPKLLNTESGVAASVCTIINPATGKVRCPYINHEPPLEGTAPPPSLSTKLMGLGTDLLKFAMSGFQTVSTEVKAERLAICAACDEYIKDDPISPKCRLCGCYMEAKAILGSSECPIKKWLAVAEMSQEGGSGCGGCGNKKSPQDANPTG